MRVRCVRFLTPAGQPTDSLSSLTVGRVYHVLEVVLDSRRWLLRVVGDSRDVVALFPREMFEIVSPTVPPGWAVGWGASHFTLGPERWQVEGFWEAYYEHERTAIEAFETEIAQIVSADP